MKKRALFVLLALFLILGTSACKWIYIKYSKILEAKAELKIISDGEKRVLFLPIHHIGLQEYYQDIAKKTDSLESLNYIVFYEQVNTNVRDRAEYESLGKKFRKITGNFNAGNGYLDTVNNSLGNMQFDKKYKLTNQPQLAQLGVNTSTAVHADVSLEELIYAYEQRNGPIELDSCDRATSLEAEYLCEALDRKSRKEFREDFILSHRNSHLAHLIHRSEADKIFVIYGASHYKGFVEELEKLDARWEEE